MPKAAKTAQAHLEDFERFWRIAPRRVNKSVAREVWVRDVRRADVDDVIQAALLWVQRCEGQDSQFIAHPATWLRKRRWHDEFENARETIVAVKQTPAQASGAEARRRAELLRAEIARDEAQPVEVSR